MSRIAVLFGLGLILGLSSPASAHCDTTRGPVVTAARAALAAGDPAAVLAWIQPGDEAEVRAAFAQTVKVRALGDDARALADRAFFETVVRLHRAGEGAPYTGLSDDAPEPIIVASDQALASGSSDALERELVDAVHAGLAARFAAARAAPSDSPGDVEAGRRHVAAYVPYVHWVEGVLAAATAEGDEHHADAGARSAAAPAGAPAPRDRLPWIVVAVLAAAALVEALLLAQRRRATRG